MNSWKDKVKVQTCHFLSCQFKQVFSLHVYDKYSLISPFWEFCEHNYRGMILSLLCRLTSGKSPFDEPKFNFSIKALLQSSFPLPMCFQQITHQDASKSVKQSKKMETAERRCYAKRSMIGAQFLLEMRARSFRRALSISLRYSASTTDAAIGAHSYWVETPIDSHQGFVLMYRLCRTNR